MMKSIIKDEIELLTPGLLLNKTAKKEIYYWIKMFIAEVGWHYPLDLIWQYEKIMDLNLPKNATILDAGAGNGIMQFVLAGNGYNVISIDFSNRKLPFLQSKLLDMTNEKPYHIDNEYTHHLSNISRLNVGKVLNKLKLGIKYFSWLFVIKGFLRKNKFGFIRYVQSDFSDLSFIASCSVDAIVSTSAVEHNPNHESLKKGVSEFCRILKPNSPMFITTSVTDKECLFDNATKGYFYDEKALKEIFQLDKAKSNFSKYGQIFKEIDKCDFLKRNLPYNYRNNANCGMPYGKWNLTYLPVGIVKCKKKVH